MFVPPSMPAYRTAPQIDWAGGAARVLGAMQAAQQQQADRKRIEMAQQVQMEEAAALGRARQEFDGNPDAMRQWSNQMYAAGRPGLAEQGLGVAEEYAEREADMLAASQWAAQHDLRVAQDARAAEQALQTQQYRDWQMDIGERREARAERAAAEPDPARIQLRQDASGRWVRINMDTGEALPTDVIGAMRDAQGNVVIDPGRLIDKAMYYRQNPEEFAQLGSRIQTDIQEQLLEVGAFELAGQLQAMEDPRQRLLRGIEDRWVQDYGVGELVAGPGTRDRKQLFDYWAEFGDPMMMATMAGIPEAEWPTTGVGTPQLAVQPTAGGNPQEWTQADVARAGATLMGR